MKSLFKLLLVVIISMTSFQSFASHAMGGDITYVCIGQNQYSIVAKLFRDCNGISLPNTLSINVSSANCGYNQNVNLSNLNGATNSFIAPLCDPSQDACVNPNGVYGVEQYFYRGIITLPTCVNGDDFVLSWSDCCRNAAITTLNNPGGASIYLYANLDNTLPECNNSPAFNFEPTVYLCLGQENHFNNGITDIDGDDLQFSLTNCLEDATTPVSYGAGFSATQPLTTSSISIDAETGQIDLMPTALEVGVICILVEEFRFGVKIGETIRDLQFTVLDCGTNDLPIVSGFDGTASPTGATGSYDYTACVGETIEFDLTSFDVQGQPTVASQTIEMDWGIGIAGASFVIDDVTSTLPTATFKWTPTMSDIGINFFTVSIKDDACIFNGVSVFTYKIDVQASGLNFDIQTPDTVMAQNEVLTIDAFTTNFGPGISYDWSTGDTIGLSCISGPGCQDPTFSPPTLGTYTLICIMSNSGSTTSCTSTDTLTVHVTTNTNTISDFVNNVSINPNPLTTNATLSYQLNQRSDVIVEVYDLVGHKVGTIVNETQSAGQQEIQIGNAINQVQGVYFVRLSINGETITKKVVVQ